MPARVQHKRSSVAGNVPDPSQLEVGEIAINFPDGYIYTKNGANAVIRLTGRMALSQPTDQIAGDSYLDTATGKIYVYYNLNGGGETWREVAPAENLSPFVKHDGTVAMTGHLTVLTGATGNQAVGYNQVVSMIGGDLDDYVKKDGTTAMTGALELPGDPTDDLHAATKAYVDEAVEIATPDLDAYLAKSGGVMSGQITLPGGGTGNQAASATELAAAIAAHQALPDPHPQYTTDVALAAHKAAGASEHPVATGAAHGFMSSTDKTRFDTMVVAADADIVTGTDNAKYITPLRFDTFMDTYVFAIIRPKLAANTTVYVRVGGDDNNDGSANDDDNAFATPQGAENYLRGVDFNGKTVTVQIADGTYTAALTVLPKVGLHQPSDYLFKGNASDITAVKISTTGAHSVTVTGAGAMCRLTDIELNCSGVADGNDTCVYAVNKGLVEVEDLYLHDCIGGLRAQYHGLINVTGDMQVSRGTSTGAANPIIANFQGFVNARDVHWTLVNTGGFNIWAQATSNSLIDLFGDTYTGNSGVTGIRHYAANGGGIIIGSGHTLPGNTSGTTTNPGWTST